MRHTVGAFLGFTSNETKYEMNNQFSHNKNLNDKFKECCRDAWTKFRVLKDYEGNDFGFVRDSRNKITGVVFGIEPSYQWDELQVIKIDFKDKNKCCLLEGIAFGPWGSNVVMHSRVYEDYKRNCAFKNFIDKWYDDLVTAAYNK